MIGYTFHGMNMSQLALWFFIYSFCGWAMECVVIRIQLGRWENRGFAKLPFCVIYGFGVFIAYHLFQPIEHNYVALYIWGCIAATIFEYLTALAAADIAGGSYVFKVNIVIIVQRYVCYHFFLNMNVIIL